MEEGRWRKSKCRKEEGSLSAFPIGKELSGRIVDCDFSFLNPQQL